MGKRMDKGQEIELTAVRPIVLAMARKFFRASRLDGDPEDVTQEVLLRLWEAMRKGDDIRSKEAWAVTTTRNCCISLWRKAKKGKILPLSDEVKAAESPSIRIEESEAETVMNKVLEKLPGNTRYLLQLRARGLSLDEMAAVTGRPKCSIRDMRPVTAKASGAGMRRFPRI